MACGIFLDQDQTHVPCMGRQILIHSATREVLDFTLHFKPSVGLVKCMMTCIPHYTLREQCRYPKNPCALPVRPPFPETPDLAVSLVLPLPQCHILETPLVCSLSSFHSAVCM